MIYKVFELFELTEVNETLDLNYLIKENHDILRLDNVNVSGTFNKNDQEVFVNLEVNLNCYLPCGRTFKEVLVPLSFHVDAILSETDDADFKLAQEINLDEIVYSYILIEKPYVVYHESSKAFEEEKISTINPAFAKLIEE